MGDYLHQDVPTPDLAHPDSAIRLASVVHRFKIPRMTRKVDFCKSFKTVGTNDKTRKLMVAASDARERLAEGLAAAKISAERVSGDAQKYQPLIHSVLLSCKVQPEQARLDERLIFEWKSGMENPKSTSSYKSEAMMYDLVMDLATDGFAHAVGATEKSISGDFAAASREYAAAAGIFDNLAEDQLPKWIAKGSNVDEGNLPVECMPSVACALVQLFMANAQQMAIATVLLKDGTPNYSLVAKLCLGVAEQLEGFLADVRRAGDALSRLDPDFLTLLSLQIAVQNALSLYFQARKLWEEQQFGLAIAMLNEAGLALKERAHSGAKGVPSVSSGVLKPLADDMKDLRNHFSLILRAYEKDNSSVYFMNVPPKVPAASKLQEGLKMNKKTEFKLHEAEPVLLAIPAKRGGMTRTDSDLARELQEKLNSGLA